MYNDELANNMSLYVNSSYLADMQIQDIFEVTIHYNRRCITMFGYMQGGHVFNTVFRM